MDKKYDLSIFKAENSNGFLMLKKSLFVLISVLCAGACNTITGQMTVTLRPGAEDGKDVIISTLTPNANSGFSSDFNAVAWTYSGEFFIYRSLIEFDLSFFPPGTSIIHATVTLFNNPSSTTNSGEHSSLTGSNEAYLLRVTDQWNESTVTWNNQPGVTMENPVYLPQSVSPHQNYDIEVTEQIQDMVDHPDNNHGFMLRLITEDTYRCLVFASSDHPDQALHPKLVINYNAPVLADFSYTVAIEDKTVSFCNQSQNATSFLWDFGDGIHSILKDPVHTYQQYGDYEVTLVASNELYADTVTKLVKVCERPIADFDYRIEGFQLTLTNLSQHALSCYWDFGNGFFSQVENPIYIYNEEGEYELRLIVYNDCDSDTMTRHIWVCLAPVAGFDYICNQKTIYFVNTSMMWDSCVWYFGDDIGSVLENPEHTYLEEGDYEVNLIVMRYCGDDTLTGEMTEILQVPCSPTAAFDYGINEMEVIFNNHSLNATSFSWDFGDGITSEEMEPIHTYEEVGDYEVQLIAKNDHGSDTAQSLINVTSVPGLTGDHSIIVFPNPVRDVLTVKIMGHSGETLRLELYNSYGQCIKNKIIRIENAITIESFDMLIEPAGCYYLRITGGDHSYSGKIIHK